MPLFINLQIIYFKWILLIFIYYFIINFNDIFTLILYMMDELMK